MRSTLKFLFLLFSLSSCASGNWQHQSGNNTNLSLDKNFCDSFAVNSEIELPLLAWSDNLATIGTNFESVVEHMQIWHFYLSSVHSFNNLSRDENFTMMPMSFKSLQSERVNPKSAHASNAMLAAVDTFESAGLTIHETELG